MPAPPNTTNSPQMGDMCLVCESELDAISSHNALSDTPETDAVMMTFGLVEMHLPDKSHQLVNADFARSMERERNKEMGYRGQWCDKARKAEAALDALEDLTRELAATKKTLGTLIAWSVVELGEDNAQRLLDMMSPENAGAMTPEKDQDHEK